MKNKKKYSVCLLLLITCKLWAEAPEWFIPLRDAVYEQQLSGGENLSIYTSVKQQAENIASEVERYIIFAKCENLMGQAYQREGKNTDAVTHYERGESYSKLALGKQPTSEGYYVLAESISLLCDLKGFGYQVKNGQRFIDNANKAISLDPHNAAAKYLLAAMYAFPNPPFRNLTKAKQRLEDILNNDNEYMPKDVCFKVYYALGVVYQKENKPNDAKSWFEKALLLYPTNKDVKNRLKEISHN